MKSNKEKSFKFLFKASLPIVLFVQLSGCASIVGTLCLNAEGGGCGNHAASVPYIGVGGDLAALFTNTIPFYVKPLPLVDLPFSLVLDTLLLPITIPNFIKNIINDQKKDNPKPNEATK